MVSVFDAIILAIVQGLTEWLPISSSGHLVIFQQIFNMDVPVAFDLMLHIGTLISVVALLWKDMWKIVESIFTFKFKRSESKMGFYLIVASIFTGLIALAFRDFLEFLFSDLSVVGTALIINGFILFLTKHTGGRGRIKFIDSIIIGISQGFSVVPGLSRSGLTISTGLFRKIDKKTVFKFSFLLSFIAIIGANVFGAKALSWEGISLETVSIGIIISAMTGYIALRMLMKTIIGKRFYMFAYYCWLIGFTLLVFSVFLY